jgi:U3 small nucleolar RNA-associated protein 3
VFCYHEQSIGATPAGLQWLLNKAVVQTTATLNLAVYLMLKREAITHGQDPAMMQTHPIMAHLQKWNTTLSQIQDVEAQHGLAEQMRHVVRASSLLSGDAISVSSSDDGNESNSGDNSSSEDEEDNVHVDKNVVETDKLERSLVAGGSEDSSFSKDDGNDDDEDSPSEDEDNDEEARARSVLTEARFGLRPNEVANHDESGRKRRRAVMLDAGDDEDRVVTAAAAKQKAKKSKSSLAGTLNSIEQRTANKTKKLMQATENVDDDTKIRRGLEMMEEELGPASDDEGKPNTKDDADKKERGRTGQEDEGDDDNNEFYDKLSKRSQAHRDYKKQLHAVAPKFPRVDGMVAGERAASRHIIKNRGLVAHKKKINRNPRVKKREQFRKALIRRKGAVREVRTNEGHRYGGEETGIKTNLSRSRKLA